MPLDTDAYIRGLAAAHGLTPEPGDTDGADLARRATAAELAAITARAQALHDWSETVIADHETQPAASAGRGRTARRKHTPAENRRNAARRRAHQRRTRQHA